jgi:hypothetical protein
VLKVRLENGLAAVFKPRSKLPLGDRRYKGEIAAYRLARALGLGNVPPAMPRGFTASQLRRAMGTPEATEEFDSKIRADADGTVRGALMPWIEHYQEQPLEQAAWRAKWEKWLTYADAQLAPEDRALAATISTMIAFDYITANWDRWSGNNVARDGSTGTVLFVDNDGAFYETPPAQSLVHQLAMLRRIQRFSRGFVVALRALDESTLNDAFGQDLHGEPLLPDKVVAAADARRKTVLEAIDAQILRAGEPATLALP